MPDLPACAVALELSAFASVLVEAVPFVAAVPLGGALPFDAVEVFTRSGSGIDPPAAGLDVEPPDATRAGGGAGDVSEQQQLLVALLHLLHVLVAICFQTVLSQRYVGQTKDVGTRIPDRRAVG